MLLLLVLIAVQWTLIRQNGQLRNVVFQQGEMISIRDQAIAQYNDELTAAGDMLKGCTVR